MAAQKDVRLMTNKCEHVSHLQFELIWLRMALIFRHFILSRDWQPAQELYRRILFEETQTYQSREITRQI